MAGASSAVAHKVLEVRDLSVSFDGFKAVDCLSLSVDASELRVVIGPNGAGKTSLLDMICGKTRPTSGQIFFDGQDVTRLSEDRRVKLGIGCKFQTPLVYEDLTVFENLEISLPQGQGVFSSLFFQRDARVKQVIQATAEQVFLQGMLGQKAGQLSHGKKQWLEIGMLLTQNPKLLLLDEPVAGMSPHEREQTAELLQRISRGKSVLVIEHDMDFVKRIAHKVTVLHQGRLLSEGTAAQVQTDPRVIDVYLGH